MVKGLQDHSIKSVSHKTPYSGQPTN